MKKKYEKPDILFESFALSQSISAGCEMIAGNAAQYVCPVLVVKTPGFDDDDPYIIFGDGPCVSKPVGGNDSICYHVPTADNNVFNS